MALSPLLMGKVMLGRPLAGALQTELSAGPDLRKDLARVIGYVSKGQSST